MFYMTTLPSKAKVVIIGGGIHGLSTAWKLSKLTKILVTSLS
ncbi:MAG: hypothetical protein CM1200mP13_03850 [Candidatus Pelagibacterales bacterium]|nr:MAG: hypothetical protein CM1200mP13_03850 [Pelagibacterales bacterium]